MSLGDDDRAQPLIDRFDRPMRDLRISVTDRCNFRCRYCMPREAFGPEYPYLRRGEILSFEEITRLARISCQLGVRKIRLTGGEPLLRSDLPKLVDMLATIPDVEIALTTNGSFLAQQAQALADAGLARVTVSLDSIDEQVFRAMSDVEYSVSQVLAGIEAAAAVGLRPIKINTVVQKGVNDHTIVDLARHFKGSGHIVRFIEFMDVGNTNGWKHDHVLPGGVVVERISKELPLEAAEANYRGEVARRYRYVDGDGEIGIIASVTGPFCGDCSRVRLSAAGELVTCLFAAGGTDLRAPVRSGASDEELAALIRRVWTARVDRYSEQRMRGATDLVRIEMSYIGG